MRLYTDDEDLKRLDNIHAIKFMKFQQRSCLIFMLVIPFISGIIVRLCGFPIDADFFISLGIATIFVDLYCLLLYMKIKSEMRLVELEYKLNNSGTCEILKWTDF